LKVANECNGSFVKLDVTKRNDWLNFRSHIESEYGGKLDGMVNNAGIATIGKRESFSRFDSDDYPII
jgi:NADP-dependent 3-hydroxy acid dehydrogenase YdfG